MRHFFLILLISKSMLAQNRQKGSYTVYLNNASGSIKAEVVYENKKISVQEDLTYYWYTSNKIIETKGGFDGRILDGAYTSFYLSDNLKEKGIFESGVKDDTWKAWYENGRVKEISNWKNGLKHGTSKKYDARGVLLTESNYKNGKLNGYEIIYEGDKPISKKKYDNGEEVLPKVKKVKADSTNSDSKGILNWFKKKEKQANSEPERITDKKEKQPNIGADRIPDRKNKKQKQKESIKQEKVKPEPDRKEKVPLAQRLKNLFNKKEKDTANELAKAKK